MKSRAVDRKGVTFLELLLTMIVGLVVLTSIYSVLISQSREYQVQRENVDVAETLKSAATILTSELRPASASRGDLYSIAAQTISLRSFQTAGTFCGEASPRFGAWQPPGPFATGATHTAPVCAPPKGTAGTPPRVVELSFQSIAADTVGLRVASTIRGFRPTTYSLVQSGGKWWLGRKIGTAGSWDLVTGPLKSAADSGLAIAYYTSAGALTAVPSQVAMVVVTLRAESYLDVRGKAGARAPRADSVSVTAYLRN